VQKALTPFDQQFFQFNLITLDFYQPDLFFHHSINNPIPKKQESDSSTDFLRVALFALKQIVSYLETVSRKLELLS